MDFNASEFLDELQKKVVKENTGKPIIEEFDDEDTSTDSTNRQTMSPEETDEFNKSIQDLHAKAGGLNTGDRVSFSDNTGKVRQGEIIAIKDGDTNTVKFNIKTDDGEVFEDVTEDHVWSENEDEGY